MTHATLLTIISSDSYYLVTGLVTPRTLRDLRKHVSGTEKTGVQVEYQRLVYVAKEDIHGKFVEATKEYNHSKNRYHNILPYEKNRVKLAYQVRYFCYQTLVFCHQVVKV